MTQPWDINLVEIKINTASALSKRCYSPHAVGLSQSISEMEQLMWLTGKTGSRLQLRLTDYSCCCLLPATCCFKQHVESNMYVAGQHIAWCKRGFRYLQ